VIEGIGGGDGRKRCHRNGYVGVRSGDTLDFVERGEIEEGGRRAVPKLGEGGSDGMGWYSTHILR